MHERDSSVTQHKNRGGKPAQGARRIWRGFTLIDVLVTMAVIAVLISLLSPSLTSIRESARQIVCRSNVRQLGIGISMYADTNGDRIPRSVNVPPGATGGQPWDTMDLRLDSTGSLPGNWDGLGYLYKEEILSAPKLYYCPSHHGNHPFANYSGDFAGSTAGIVGNFQYRAMGLARPITPLDPSPPAETHLSLIDPQIALVADGMRTQEDFNHRVAANVLRAGLSVDWWHDQAGQLVDTLPKDGQLPNVQIFQNAWESLDNPGR